MSVLGKILVKLGLDSSQFTQGTRAAERQTQTFTGKIGGMFSKMFAGLAIGAAIKKAFDFSKEAYEAAAQAQGVKIAFDRLNDPNLLNNLKEATKGTVDELKLMQLAVQSKNFRLPVEQLGTYLKFATKRAQETGVSVDYLTNSIITGLGRKSVLILDNLGISAVEIREEMKKGGDMAQAVGRIIQREMAKAGEITETGAIKTEQINAAWSDFSGNLGNTSAIKKVGNAIQDYLIRALNQLNDLVTSLGNNEVRSWLGRIDTMGDIDKAEAMASKLREVNDEIAKLEKNAPKGWFNKSVHNVISGVGALFGYETQDAKLGKMKNYRMSIYDKQQNDELASKTANHIATLDLQKKTYAELLALQKQYTGESQLINRSMVRESIADELKVRSDAAAEAAATAAEEAKKRAEEIRKAQLSYKEGENTSAIKQLEKQQGAYGSTVAYMEQLLQLRREQENYAKSDADYQRIKRENDALEAQIKLRKVDYAPGSEEDLKAQLSAAEAEMSKLNTRTAEGTQKFDELRTKIENIKWSIEHLPQNYKIEVDMDFEGLDGIQATFDREFGAINDKWGAWVEERTLDLGGVVSGSIQQMAMGIGESIGMLMSGEGSMNEALNLILIKPLADAAVSVGSLMIALGVAALNLQTLIANPWTAIAAGAALVALGAIAGTLIQSTLNNSTSGGGSSNGYGNSFTGGYSNKSSYSNSGMSQAAMGSSFENNLNITIDGELRGDVIALSTKKYEARRKR